MTAVDVLRFVMRALHVGATSVWLGSGLLYLLIRSAPRQQATEAGGLSAGAGYMYGLTMRMLSGRSFALSVVSGAYLTFDRLANPLLGLGYVGVLAVKLAMVAGIALILRLRPSRKQDTQDAIEGSSRSRWSDPGWQILALGAGALLLGVVLTMIYEAQAGLS